MRIENDKSLKVLTDYFSEEAEPLEAKILAYLVKHKFVSSSSNYWGTKLKDIFSSKDASSSSHTVYLFGNVPQSIKDAFGELTLYTFTRVVTDTGKAVEEPTGLISDRLQYNENDRLVARDTYLDAYVPLHTSAVSCRGTDNFLALQYRSTDISGIRIYSDAIYTYHPFLPGSAGSPQIGDDASGKRWNIYANEIYASSVLGGDKSRIAKWDATYTNYNAHALDTDIHTPSSDLVAKAGDTMTGKFVLHDGTDVAPFNIPSIASEPSGALMNGDIWNQSGALKFRTGGVSETLLNTVSFGEVSGSTPITMSVGGRQVYGGALTISHSTAAGYKHIPAGGASGNLLVYGAESGQAAWDTYADNSVLIKYPTLGWTAKTFEETWNELHPSAGDVAWADAIHVTSAEKTSWNEATTYWGLDGNTKVFTPYPVYVGTTATVIAETFRVFGNARIDDYLGINASPGTTYRVNVGGYVNATRYYLSGVRKDNVWDAKEPGITAGTTAQIWRGDKTWITFLGESSSTAYRGDRGKVAYDHSNLTGTPHVTSTEKNTWNAKEPAITIGTTAQYYRGDKTMQTLNQAAVAGLTTTSAVTFGSVRATGTATTAGYFTGGSSTPVGTTRTNYEGYLYATRFYEGSLRVATQNYVDTQGFYKRTDSTVYQTPAHNSSTVSFNFDTSMNIKLIPSITAVTLTVTNAEDGESGVIVLEPTNSGTLTFTNGDPSSMSYINNHRYLISVVRYGSVYLFMVANYGAVTS